ncbi:hypothetical protein IMY05_017G0097100 [Salix suchowensis]|nr:hypothetical protein IMY05_017G0097100 [Salix suchowensis]
MAHDFGNSLISPIAISVFQPDAGFASSGRIRANPRIQFLVQADTVRVNKEDPKYTSEHHVRVSPAMQCFSQFKHICVICSQVQALLILKIPQWTLPACPAAYTIGSSSEIHKSQELI